MGFKQYKGCKCPSPLKQAYMTGNNPWQRQRDNIQQGMKNAKFDRDNAMARASGRPEQRKAIQAQYEHRMAQENDAWMKAQDSYIMKHDPTFGSIAKERRRKATEEAAAMAKRQDAEHAARLKKRDSLGGRISRLGRNTIIM
jgi:hypothetical protein